MPGGVCAILDYEVESMAEYVAEMAARVVTLEATAVTPSFRKSVLTILSSTRLPRTTILLGMNYLAKRINTLRTSRAAVGTATSDIAEYLTVALMLGSKFLDDNTFQNKSWSDVSGIAVQRINAAETAWILSMDWVFYVNLDDASDYKAWLSSWDDWIRAKEQATRAAAAQAAQVSRERVPLQRLDTDVSRLGNLPRQSFQFNVQQSAVEPHHAAPAFAASKRRSYQVPSSYRIQDLAWQSPAWHGNWQNTPVTPPPDSGYGTPEYNVPATTATQQQQQPFAADWYTPFSASAYQQPPVSASSTGFLSRHTLKAQFPYSAPSPNHGFSACTCHPGPVPKQHMQHSNIFGLHHVNYGCVIG